MIYFAGFGKKGQSLENKKAIKWPPCLVFKSDNSSHD